MHFQRNMKKIQRKSSFTLGSSLLFLLIILFNLGTSIRAQEVEDQREFDYVKGSEKGPERWGELRPEWIACKKGKMQSPIDVSDRRVLILSTSDNLQRDYRPSNATLKNRGHDITLQWGGDAGSIQINGTGYALQQVHWHSPSEHTINGIRYDMELHMVHLSNDPSLKYNIAVIAVLYKFGRPDPFLWQLTADIRYMIDQQHQTRYCGIIDPNEIHMSGRRYYQYIGSLTTPPCTEGVVWTIRKEIHTVSIDQVKLLREAVHDYAKKNARPLQPDNQREIILYDPKSWNYGFINTMVMRSYLK